MTAPMNPYPEINKRIPELVKALNSIKTEYAYEQVYIGEAISLLLLLKDHLSYNNLENYDDR